jgi:transposase-like protein
MAANVLSEPHFQNEAAAFAYVEARLWPSGPVCPHCGERERIGALKGKTTRPDLYKCYACRKPFTVRMKTIFESSHLPLHLWLQVIHLMCASKKGLSTHQIQRMLRCSMKTAWFLGHRIREAMKDDPSPFYSPLGGAGKTLEADETYVGRKSTSRAYEAPAPKQAVFSLVEREGRVRSFHVPNVTAQLLRPIIGRHAHRDSRFMTDEHAIYMGSGWRFGSHHTVAHTANEYVRRTKAVEFPSGKPIVIHTNTVEGYFSILKRGIYGVYQHVSEAHLKRYLCEFDFRYSYRMKLGYNDVQRASIVIEMARGKRLTYETTRSQRAAHPA